MVEASVLRNGLGFVAERRVLTQSQNGYEVKNTTSQWASEPNLISDKDGSSKGKHGFLQKYLHKKSQNNNSGSGLISNSKSSPLFHAARCASTPIIPLLTSPPESPTVFRRPSCLDDVIVKDIPKVMISQPADSIEMNKNTKASMKPPKILKTDYDEAEIEVNIT